MPSKKFIEGIQNEIKEIRESGLYKNERVITSKAGGQIKVSTGDEVLCFCANNYLGLCDNEELIKAASETLQSHGFGLSSVRFICGTQDIHLKLEKLISKFHGTEDTILFGSCFDANGAVFQALLTDKDCVISDTLNHASIIDGIRLCKANRYLYQHLDVADLENKLKECQKFRYRLVATDGVFSMDGDIAPLDKIAALCEKYDAFLFIDECHATGFIGETGRGTPELFKCIDKVDIINSTLGKALGGGNGGYTTGKKEVIELMRQRARPYLFSNSITPCIVGASIRCLEMLMEKKQGHEKLKNLKENIQLFRGEMKKAGFKVLGHDQCPICPVLLYDAKVATAMADKLLKKGIYVIGFFFPVVPKGQARIRVQIGAHHTTEQVKRCISAFVEIGKEMGILK